MSRSRGVVFYGLLCVLIAMHFTVRPMLGWRVNVDFLVLSVLIIAVRARPGAAAVCGFGLGLMADSLTPAAFGAGALALTVVGFGASWLKSAFFADNAGVNAAFVFLGTWAFDAVFLLAEHRVRGWELLAQALLWAPLSAALTAVVGIAVLGIVRPLVAAERG